MEEDNPLGLSYTPNVGDALQGIINYGKGVARFYTKEVPAFFTGVRRAVQEEAAAPLSGGLGPAALAEDYSKSETKVAETVASGAEAIGLPEPVAGAAALAASTLLPGPAEMGLVGKAAMFTGAVVPSTKALNISKGAIKYRPDVTGLRNANARAILGDYVTDPAAVKARPGARLESDPTYKLLQKGRPPEPGEPMSKMPMFMSPHHRVDVKGSVPFFEGSTEAANIQRRADLAVGDIFPGNNPLNYIGLWDGPLSGKASKKTGVYSTDHQDVHKAMENLRRKFNLKAKGGTDAVAELPDDVKTGLLADLSMRDELAINDVLATRIDMIREAFPDMSYNEVKETILKNPQRFANLSRTSEGYLYSQIAPK